MIHETSHYKISINDATGEVTLLDLSDALIATMSYESSYGIVANWRAPVLEADSDNIHVRDATGFSVGDNVLFVNQELNEIVYHEAEITDIDVIDYRTTEVQFTPNTPAELVLVRNNGQVPTAANMKKVTHEYSSYSLEDLSSLDIDGGKHVTLEVSTDVAEIKFEFVCIDASPCVEVYVETKYKAAIEVFRERVIWTFVDDVSAVYSKGRRTITSDFAPNYWLGNQGAVIGEGIRQVLFLGNYGITSCELETDAKLVAFNLDDDRDHRFRTIAEPTPIAVANNEGNYIEKCTSAFEIDDIRENSLSLFVGASVIADKVPTSMVNPNGYMSALVLEHHADNFDYDRFLAVFYGDQNHDISTLPSSGIFANFIEFTFGIFREYLDQDGYKAGIDKAYNMGIEINYHTIPISRSWSDANRIAMKNEAIPKLHELYNAASWSDHTYNTMVDCICHDGVRPDKAAYMADLWKEYGVKYFSTGSSEDTFPVNGDDPIRAADILAENYPDRRSPLYWRHPTRLVYDDFIICGQSYIGSGRIAEADLDAMIDGWGVCSLHAYLFTQAVVSDDRYVIDHRLNTSLVLYRQKKEAGLLNVTSKGALTRYWELIERVNITPLGAGLVEITNNNAEPVKGYSVAIKNAGVLLKASDASFSPVIKSHAGHSVIAFDLDASQSINLIALTGVDVGATGSAVVGAMNNDLRTLGKYTSKTATDISSSDDIPTIIAAINSNMSELASEQTVAPVLRIGMRGSQFRSSINGFIRNRVHE